MNIISNFFKVTSRALKSSFQKDKLILVITCHNFK